MFYHSISAARERWLTSDDCTVASFVDYIVQTGQMRDAQVEVIKSFLFLIIARGNNPLAKLFVSGAYNEIGGTINGTRI